MKKLLKLGNSIYFSLMVFWLYFSIYFIFQYLNIDYSNLNRSVAKFLVILFFSSILSFHYRKYRGNKYPAPGCRVLAPNILSGFVFLPSGFKRHFEKPHHFRIVGGTGGFFQPDIVTGNFHPFQFIFHRHLPHHQCHPTGRGNQIAL